MFRETNNFINLDYYYQILGVSENATTAEIKSTYKRLAKLYHPDINPSIKAEERFKSISVAYSILVKPELRHKHDLQLAQERLDKARLASLHYRTNNPPLVRPKFNPYYRAATTPINPEAERKGTFYALGIIGLIAFLLYIGMIVSDFYRDQRVKSKINEFDHQVSHADSLFYAGKTQAALNFIDGIKASFSEETVLKNHEINYLNFRKQQADIDYENRAYQDALWGYLFFMEYTGKQDTDMLYRLAICYRSLKESGKSIFILNNLLNQGFKRIQILELIAKIYKEDLNDKELALQYYQMGLQNIIQRFKDIYGEAYRLLVSAERTPQSYKSMYYGAAELYFQKKDYNESSNLFEWVVFFEPENKKAYEYLASSYLELNDKSQACQILHRARKNGIELNFDKLKTCN
ncbi:DnaJ domain-containing protein [Marivirga sp. S37H4]|uniref:DnaJ domain-containing protein n=1 Tax=Marivirga aurantiaca TaxID=2802615 RepID=A0A934WZ14_9BACT|nr:DnaJ domain-containing protein [Marivirga aurantiaca]MBK6265823.1 DnaJ domain-containing protein [Marivirga aurantiaca]